MAVPKKKTTPSKRGLRRGGNGAYKFNKVNVVENKTSGEFQLPHHISVDGYYKGKKVLKDKVKKENKEDNKDNKEEGNKTAN